MYFKVLISYLGKRYCGAGKQINKETIQGKIEDIISTIIEEKVTSRLISRTDKGVNAYEQIIIIQCERNLVEYEEKLKKCFKISTDSNIIMHSIEEIDSSFNRKRKKIYLYKIALENYGTLVETHSYFYFINKNTVDKYIELLASFNNKEFNYFVFCKKLKDNKRPCVQTLKIETEKVLIDRKIKTLNIYITGECFLYNQIRMMIGTIANLVRRNITIISVEMLEKYKSKAPAHGLYLYEINKESD